MAVFGRAAMCVAAAAAVMAVLAPAASAGIRECGNASSVVRNVTARHLNCRDARRMARRVGFVGYGDAKYKMPGDHRYTCRTHVLGSWMVDVRCTYWFYVLRFQYHSGE